MHKFGFAIALTGALLVASSAADAQSRRVASIGARDMPPAGMCRVWFDGLSVDRQPMPTDCSTARTRALREGGRVVYSDAQQNDPRYDPRNRQQAGSRYDPRYDSRYDPRYDARTQRARDEWNRKAEKERAKAEKERYKAERRRQKEWDKSRRHADRNDDYNDDRDDDRGDRAHDRDDD